MTPYYTIGHSTLSNDQFLTILKNYNIRTVADVRSVPGSRYNPQYNMESLGTYLNENGIKYTWIERLGGFRKTKKDSVNTAWNNLSFRGYADYMQTDDFRMGISDLLSLPGPVAIMCAEAVPWRCHRSLIADYLVGIKGFTVYDIINIEARRHKLAPFAKNNNGELIYPQK